ncbi:MAG: molecular chaperone HtpG [Gammaproteobacteria bacterium]|nr:molecular chaperone HtpG [Gammaproteobacteria bacterium]
MTESSEAAATTHQFQTEVRQLLDLMIHSLYSNKEIFLRELISNASDACDKLRFEALANDKLYEGDGELGIEIEFDADRRTITVRDNGIGMNEQEVIDNLGTIAKSGTRQFFQSLTGDQARDAQLIGQFGVGFYSSFIVADDVMVTTRRAAQIPEGGVRWRSAGQGEFSIESREVPRRGTEVVLHLKEGEDELLDAYRLRSIVRRYSDHISFPIRMRKVDEAAEWETVNSATALWSRNRQDISEDEYSEFYKHVAHDFEEPLAHVHSRVEGNLEYTVLLYVPKRAPFDLWDRNVRRGVNLYVRRVFIMDDAEQLMPAYLRFVRGIVDSADLPLNVSREILQQNRQIDSIRAGCVKRILDLLAGLVRNEPEKYQGFWDEFGKVLKEGVIEDGKNRDSIAGLLRFASTHDGEDAQKVSLSDYIERMVEGQDSIYFVTADSLTTARNSPHLEVFKDNGVEVLLLTDEIDEWVVHHLTEYEGKKLASVARADLDLGFIKSKQADTTADQDGDAQDEDESADRDDAQQALVEKFKTALAERAKDVRVTNRLTSSPACLVVDQHEMGGHLERLLRAAGQDVPESRPILEINPEHPMVQRIAEEHDDQRRKDWAALLFDQALLSEGGQLTDPAGFVRRFNEMFMTILEGRAQA